MKRSPMPKRGAPLRRTALKPASPSPSARKRPTDALRASEKTYRQVRLLVLIRDGYRCVLCGRAATDTHHRQPRGMGGSAMVEGIHSPANLLALDRGCHDRIERNRAWAYGEGLLVRRGFDPAETPVRLSAGRWVLFTASGTIVASAPRRALATPANDEDIETQ